jgi:hypothetical protein
MIYQVRPSFSQRTNRVIIHVSVIPLIAIYYYKRVSTACSYLGIPMYFRLM